jgi:SRSO17 transposase
VNLKRLKKVSAQLDKFVSFFKKELGRSERTHWCRMYLCGLLLNGERKSIQPMAERLPEGNSQALQQFVSQSPWDYSTIQIKLAKYLIKKTRSKAGVLVLDDTSFPKKGVKSVGVAHQYCGALGKVSNCQSVVTWHYSTTDGTHFPINAELFLPQKWTEDKKRLKAAGVPHRRFKFQKKWQLALDLLNSISIEELPYEAIVFDAGYGEVREFLKVLDQRGITFVAQIPETHSFWPLDIETQFAQKKTGRPRVYPSVEDKESRPLSAKKWKNLHIKEGGHWQTISLPLKSKKETEVFVVRVREVIAQAFYRPGDERWLIVEKFGENEFKYYVSNATGKTALDVMVRWLHRRWEIEQGYQQLKEELGMDHFEGRSWRGLHHHITLCFMAYAFLTMLRRHEGKKNQHDSASCKKNA